MPNGKGDQWTMTTHHFNPEKDLAPMPFDERICQQALKMKNAGLVWRPHVGCFVWDRDEVIRPASPFPGRIYFILSMTRFVEIFGSIEQITAKLVWLPTWHQAQLVYRQMRGTNAARDVQGPENQTFSATEDLIHIYGLIIEALNEKNHRVPLEKSST